MVSYSKLLSKRRVDVIFKIEPAIIKQIYNFYGVYGKSLYNYIFYAHFERAVWDGDLLEARGKNMSSLSEKRKKLRKYVFSCKTEFCISD